MDIQWVSTDQIKPYPRNPRKNAQAVDKVAYSLKTYGWQQPIVVDVDSIIIAGHTRWLAAQQLKMDKIPIRIAKELTPEQVRTYRIADNRLSEEAEWDEALLREELNLLKDMETELSLTGFDERELTQLLGGLSEESSETTDHWLNETLVVSQPGDVWELGEHRVMCGDATCQSDMEALLGGITVDLVFTDPPYNVDYTPLHSQALTRRLQNDHLDDAAYLRFLRTAVAQAMPFVKPTASWYVCHASQSQQVVQQALEENQLIIRSQLVWAKNHFVLNRGRYKTQHELIFYAYRRGHADLWYGDRSQSTLWSIDKPLRCDLHPTMKPLALVQKALENSSLAGDRILDIFGGSGSTLIACAHTHRQAYVMEVEPRYVDATVRRWQQHTGKSAVLSGTDRTFEDCVSARQGRSHEQ
jgi:DNA modification methylase